MRVLVCGNRDFEDYRLVEEILNSRDKARPIRVIIEGGALGPDRFARTWAASKHVEVLTFPADWKTHGKAAGHIRNKQMLVEGRPDLVIAFYCREGPSGTSNMVGIARKAAVETLEIEDIKGQHDARGRR